MAERNHSITNKIEELTGSLNRTTDVLSTADRMIDHYKDLNKEQEYEITRLQNDLYRVNSSYKEKEQYERDLLHQSILKSKRDGHDSYSDTTDREQHHRSSRHHRKKKATLKKPIKSSSKVHFQENDSPQSDDLEASFNEIERRQHRLERESKKDKIMRDREIDELDISLRKSMLQSYVSSNIQQSEDVMNTRLKKIQDKIEEEHESWKKQQLEIKNMAEDMKSLKDSVKVALTPKRKHHSRNSSDSEEEIEEEKHKSKKTYKKRLRSDDNTIISLHEELKKKEIEQRRMEDTVEEIQTLGLMKSNQLQLLESQLHQEKNEKLKLSESVQDLREKMSSVEKERSELLAHLSDIKAEARSNQLANQKAQQTIPELKTLLEKSERQRDKFYEHSVSLQAELKTKEDVVKKLVDRNEELSGHLKHTENEREKYTNQVDQTNEKYELCKKNINKLESSLFQCEEKLNISLRSKSELKQKAVATIKEYKSKCQDYEKLISYHKEKEVQLAMTSSEKKELEINNLMIQKEYQELTIELKQTKDHLIQLETKHQNEKIKFKDLLIKSRDNASQKIASFKEGNDKLANENSTLATKLAEETNKRKEFETLLHEHYEKTLNSKQEDFSLKSQLEDEQKRYQHMSKSLEETELALKLKLKHLSDDLQQSLHENKKIEEKCSNIANRFDETSNKLEKEIREASVDKETIKELKVKLKSAIDENGKIRKQYHIVKDEFNKKSKILEDRLSNQEVNTRSDSAMISQPNEVSKDQDNSKILSFIMGDLENLHRLLSYEDENQTPVMEIPENITVESRDRLKDYRNKFNSCFTVVRTLKDRFYHQKMLIRKAQDKIRNQIKENVELKKSLNEEIKDLKQQNDFFRGQTHSHESQLQSIQNSIDSKNEKIELYQNKIKTLTKHLEECTRALHKSVEADRERKDVLNEIEKLKNEREEHQKIDENFYRCSEKLDILSEQLDEAKCSLTQIKKDNIDETAFTSKLIETFASVSPTRKRRHFAFNSPPIKSSRKLFNNESQPPFFSTVKDDEARLLNENSNVEQDKDPMSLNDIEFNRFMLSTGSLNAENPHSQNAESSTFS